MFSGVFLLGPLVQDEDKYYALLALKEMDKREGQRQAQKAKVQKALDDNLRKADLEKRPRPLKRWMVRHPPVLSINRL
jgi:hypothetical protein